MKTLSTESPTVKDQNNLPGLHVPKRLASDHADDLTEMELRHLERLAKTTNDNSEPGHSSDSSETYMEARPTHLIEILAPLAPRLTPDVETRAELHWLHEHALVRQGQGHSTLSEFPSATAANLLGVNFPTTDLRRLTLYAQTVLASRGQNILSWILVAVLGVLLLEGFGKETTFDLSWAGLALLLAALRSAITFLARKPNV